MKELPNTPAPFRQWLETTFDPTDVIAEQWTACSCPLATWLQEAKIAGDPYVFPTFENEPGLWRDLDDIDEGTWPEPRELPGWADQFALKIDRLGRERGEGGFGPVTAADCLRILDEATGAATA